MMPITHVSHYSKAGFEFHGRAEGSVMNLMFELDGQGLSALNGGPAFTFNEAVSLQVDCRTQVELDHYGNALGYGGPLQAQQCGWLKARFGLSGPSVPQTLAQMMCDPDPSRSERMLLALLEKNSISRPCSEPSRHRANTLGAGP